MKNDYEIIEHTADVGVKAFGTNISECFAHAAKGMFDIITDSSSIDEVGEYNLKLHAEDLEQLLVDFLSELLFLHSSRNLVFGSFTVEINEETVELFANIKGETLDLEKHHYGVEIKAVTYHMLQVHSNEPPYVQVLFDI
jgi:SHS2 domain-containing protein